MLLMTHYYSVYQIANIHFFDQLFPQTFFFVPHHYENGCSLFFEKLNSRIITELGNIYK